MIDRREFLRKTTIAAVGAAILPALPRIEPSPYFYPEQRFYVRIAIDNHVSKMAAEGRGAFAELNDRILNKMWSSWADMEVRHL